MEKDKEKEKKNRIGVAQNKKKTRDTTTSDNIGQSSSREARGPKYRGKEMAQETT